MNRLIISILLLAIFSSYPLVAGPLTDAAKKEFKHFRLAIEKFPPSLRDALGVLKVATDKEDINIAGIILYAQGKPCRNVLIEYLGDNSDKLVLENNHNGKKIVIHFFESLWPSMLNAEKKKMLGVEERFYFPDIAAQFALDAVDTEAFTSFEEGRILAAIVAVFTLANGDIPIILGKLDNEAASMLLIHSARLAIKYSDLKIFRTAFSLIRLGTPNFILTKPYVTAIDAYIQENSIRRESSVAASIQLTLGRALSSGSLTRYKQHKL